MVKSENINKKQAHHLVFIHKLFDFRNNSKKNTLQIITIQLLPNCVLMYMKQHICFYFKFLFSFDSLTYFINKKDPADVNNYRPIRIATALSKVLEQVLLSRLSRYMWTADSEVGFKQAQGTEIPTLHSSKQQILP